MMDYLGQDRRRNERGFSTIQLIVTLAVVSIVIGFALVNVSSARASLRLQNSVRLLGGYMEKARLDAVRRHDTASVVFTNTSTYNITMDFDGDGVVQTRSFSFDDGVSVISTPLPSVSFNWRGRTSACTITFAMQGSNGDQSWVDVSDAGDVTVNSSVDTLPTPSYTNVNASADIYSNMVVAGATVRNNTADCGGSGGGTPPPIVGSGSGGCTVTATPSSISIKKSGGTTGTVAISVSSSSTVTASGPSNLLISPVSRSIGGGGSGNFSITSKNNTRGTFAVTFSSACTSVTVLVKVTN